MRKTARLYVFLMLAVLIPALPGMASVSWGATPLVDGGGRHTVAVRPDGTLWTWGDNEFGQLGDGTTVSRNSPVKIGTGTDWAAVSAGFFHTVALKSDHTLWAWGDNTKGQLGDGSIAFSQPAPVRVGADSNWASVAAGDFHTLALKTDGTLWAWGENSSGQVGDGSVVPNNQPVPVKIGSDSDWVAIAAGGSHSVALKSNHTLWGWGANNSGQLGNGTHISAVAPVQIVLPAPFINNDWTAVAAGQSHTVALKADGTLHGWGNNTFGQLGNGTTLDSDIPAQEAGQATNWVAVATGDTHSLGRQADGTLRAWGGNLTGQLGNGTNLDADAPVKVGTDNDWSDASAGSAHTVALKANGDIWSWGDNAFGQLGDGTNIARNTPVPVVQARFLAKGDLDQNGTVNIGDALRALRIAVGIIPPTADDLITGDVAPPGGVIDIADALLILRKSVGLSSF